MNNLMNLTADSTIEEIENAAYNYACNLINGVCAQEIAEDLVQGGHDDIPSVLFEVHDNSAQYSPYEFFCKAMNDRDDCDDAWLAFDDTLSSTLADYNSIDETLYKAVKGDLQNMLDDATEEIMESAEHSFKDKLNGDDSVSIQGIEFDTADALQTLDPIGYQEMLNNHADALASDDETLEKIQDALDNL